MIRQTAPSVAAHMAPLKTEQWVADTWQRMLPNMARPSEMVNGSVSYPQLVPASIPEPQPVTPEPKQGFLGRLFGLGGEQRSEAVSTTAPEPQSQPVASETTPKGDITLRPFVPIVSEELQPSAAQQARERRTARRHRRQRGTSFRTGQQSGQ